MSSKWHLRSFIPRSNNSLKADTNILSFQTRSSSSNLWRLHWIRCHFWEIYVLASVSPLTSNRHKMMYKKNSSSRTTKLISRCNFLNTSKESATKRIKLTKRIRIWTFKFCQMRNYSYMKTFHSKQVILLTFSLFWRPFKSKTRTFRILCRKPKVLWVRICLIGPSISIAKPLTFICK